jgi:hypothetical protein
MAKTLTDQQKLFLEVLFDEAKGDLREAKKLANYHPTYPLSQVMKTLQDEIVEATKTFIARTGPKAAYSISGIIDNPTQLGVKEKLAAAKDILDRMGIVKTEKIDITSNGLFILPAKAEEEND